FDIERSLKFKSEAFRTAAPTQLEAASIADQPSILHNSFTARQIDFERLLIPDAHPLDRCAPLSVRERATQPFASAQPAAREPERSAQGSFTNRFSFALWEEGGETKIFGEDRAAQWSRVGPTDREIDRDTSAEGIPAKDPSHGRVRWALPVCSRHTRAPPACIGETSISFAAIGWKAPRRLWLRKRSAFDEAHLDEAVAQELSKIGEVREANIEVEARHVERAVDAPDGRRAPGEALRKRTDGGDVLERDAVKDGVHLEDPIIKEATVEGERASILT